MKRSKKLCILLGVLLVASVAAFAAIRLEERQENIQNSDEIILALDSDSVQALSWAYEGTSLAFHKGETWLYDEDEAFPVDEEKIGELLSLFQEFGVSFVIEDVEDYSQYGLDDPTCTISLTTEEESYEIQLGNYSTMDAQRYVSIGDGNVYLVSTDPMESFEITLSDLIDNDEVPSFSQVTSLQFSGGENYAVTYEEDSKNTYCEEDVYFTELDGESQPLDTSRVKSYLSAISYLDLTDYVTYNATEEELESYGLDDPELTVTVDYTYEDEEGQEVPDTFVLHISRDPAERSAGEETAGEEASQEETAPEESDAEEEEEITAYARVGDSQIVYQITAYDYEELMAASYNDLRHQEVLSASFQDITQIDITLEEANYTLTAQEGEDEDGERVWLYQEEEIEVDSLQSAIEGLTADSFTSEQPTEKEEISLTVHLDNENFPEVTINLYRYDGANCIAVVDGEPVSLVGRTDVVELIEAVNAIVLN